MPPPLDREDVELPLDVRAGRVVAGTADDARGMTRDRFEVVRQRRVIDRLRGHDAARRERDEQADHNPRDQRTLQ